jgi:hypothetical protein
LTELSKSIKSFQEDLELLGIEDNVVTTTFTEFGRKPVQNGNRGTDHGNFGPMFVIGKPVHGGMTGNHMSLDAFSLTGNVKHFDDTQMQHDYRQVYSAIIGDFLGASSQTITDTELDDYDISRLNLIASPILGSPSSNESQQKIVMTPNPVLNDAVVRFHSPLWIRGGLAIYDTQGRQVQKMTIDFSSGQNVIPVNLGHLSRGLYVLTLTDDSNHTMSSLKFTKD